MEISQLLREWSEGDPSALTRLMPLVYDELRNIASHHLRQERPEHTFTPTALVHEAYLRLIDQHSPDWESRTHFFGAAAEIMRRILVDYARKRSAQKRGATLVRVDLSEVNVPIVDRDLDLQSLDVSLDRLANLDPRAARIVELRFFGGLSIEATAYTMHLSPATIKREWTAAKAWLMNDLSIQLVRS